MSKPARRIAVPGQTCFPPLIHPFKTAAPVEGGVTALRASIRGRLAYHDCVGKHTKLIEMERTRRKAEGLGDDVSDMMEKAEAAKKDVLNSRKVRKPLTRNEATTLRGLMGSDNYALYKRTLEITESQKDNTPPPMPQKLRQTIEKNKKHVKPKVDSLSQWFLVYGAPSVEMPPGMMSNFVPGGKKCCGERSAIVVCKKGALTKAGPVTDYNKD